MEKVLREKEPRRVLRGEAVHLTGTITQGPAPITKGVQFPSPQILASWLMGTVRDGRVKAAVRVLGQSVVQGSASCGFQE